jgi:hypothetical protein
MVCASQISGVHKTSVTVQSQGFKSSEVDISVASLSEDEDND